MSKFRINNLIGIVSKGRWERLMCFSAPTSYLVTLDYLR